MVEVLHIKVADYRKTLELARKSLGRPGALDEAMVDLGIDAFLVLLDGGAIEVDGQLLELTAVAYRGGFPITLEAMAAHARAYGQTDRLRKLLDDEQGESL